MKWFPGHEAVKEDLRWPQGEVPDRNPSPAEVLLLSFFLILTLAWRIYLASTARYNPDEFLFAGHCARLFHGLIPGRDFPLNHSPLFFYFLSRFFRAIDNQVGLLDHLRMIQFGETIAFLVLLFFFVRRVFGGRCAIYAVLLVHSFDFFTERTIQFRPDLWGYFLFILGIFLWSAEERPWRLTIRTMVASVFVALSVAFFMNMLFYLLGLFLWIIVESLKRKRLRAAVPLLVFQTAAVAVIGLIAALLVYGFNFLMSITDFAHLLFGKKYFLPSAEGTTKIVKDLVLGNILPIGLAILVFVEIHLHILKIRSANRHLILIVLLGDCGILFLASMRYLLEPRLFEQHFFLWAIPAAILLAYRLSILSPDKTGWSLKPSFLILAIIFLWSFHGAVALYKEEISNRITERKELDDFRTSWAHTKPDAKSIGEWLSFKPKEYFTPFRYTSRDLQRRRISFLLEHTREGDLVLTEYYSPPYRDIPVKVPQGMILLTYYKFDSESRKGLEGQFIDLLHRWDPYTTMQERNLEERMLAMIERSSPRLIFLDGPFADLFRSSERFSQFVSSKYLLTVVVKDGMIYALRKS